MRNSLRLEYYFQIDFRDIPVLECADAFHDLYADHDVLRTGRPGERIRPQKDRTASGSDSGSAYGAPASFGGYSAPSQSSASDFAMLDDDDAQLPF